MPAKRALWRTARRGDRAVSDAGAGTRLAVRHADDFREVRGRIDGTVLMPLL